MKNVLVIDASNIRGGGGLSHLQEILSAKTFFQGYFQRIFIWAADNTLKELPEHPELQKCSHELLQKGYFAIWRWKRQVLKPFVLKHQALLFIPGGGYSSLPFVTMCQNLLPIDTKELHRFFPHKMWFKLWILRFIHLYSYKKAAGIIFLNRYSYQVLPKSLCQKIKSKVFIEHGLNKRFFENTPYTTEKPSKTLRLLYVSTISLYKHQWLLAKAVFSLRNEGYDVALDLIGDGYRPAMELLNKELAKNSHSKAVLYHGKISYDKIHLYYQEADAFIFASTCETYGMVITEAMASGLPIICSKYSSMPETVGDAGLYFDPLDIESIKTTIIHLYHNPDLRCNLSKKSIDKASKLSWDKTAMQTALFLSQINASLD